MGGSTSSAVEYPRPAVRRLRIYAFDPQSSIQLSTAVVNDMVLELPWESRWESPLQPGPVNDYLEVVDHDPGSGAFYDPVDLNDPMLLAQNGLPPSEGRPQFHQQMVFAVAMRTIRTFERALGRVVLWAGDKKAPSGDMERSFTQRLRIYPHALREANAYYSPDKRALLFGYFRPDSSSREEVHARWVFTCLSQDIIAHETSHAILHGMQRRSIEASNVDALAFHEAFADIVALLQHFGMGDVLRQELAASRGSLRERGLLTGLGEQFGRGTGKKGALRYALDMLSAERQGGGVAESPGSVRTIADTSEPHARGGFLVAAIFDAFVTIYERRTADLMRLGRAGTRGPDEPLAAELVARLASEAAKAADHVLRMCVRALDYVPPVSCRFGEYLRAIITADTDLVPDDPLRYRVAFVEAFRKRQITVPGCISMAPDSLLWAPPEAAGLTRLAKIYGKAEDPITAAFQSVLARLQLTVAFDGKRGYTKGDFAGARNLRDLSMKVVLHNQRTIHEWFAEDSASDEDWEKLVGMRLLRFDHIARTRTVPRMDSITSKEDGTPLFEVHSARIANRAGPNGEEVHQLIVQMTQRRRAYFDPAEQKAADAGRWEEIGKARWSAPDFWFRGGSTLHVDLRDGTLLRVIRKRIDDDDRLATERAFRLDEPAEAAIGAGDAEPFAFMHRSL